MPSLSRKRTSGVPATFTASGAPVASSEVRATGVQTFAKPSNTRTSFLAPIWWREGAESTGAWCGAVTTGRRCALATTRKAEARMPEDKTKTPGHWGGPGALT